MVATASPASGVLRNLTYRTGGDLALDLRGMTTYAYGYNAAKRLVSVTQNGSAGGAYGYDFSGSRVWRRTYGSGAAQTAYIYDQDGHLLAEHDATTGAVNREYVWIDDLPVAVITISGGVSTYDYIHTGQIDEPLAVTDSTQAIVWNAYVDPYGTANFIGTPTLTLDMRLPGQSFQLEAGSLHQNGWRDYDPSLGRYIEADPLGILAGQNLYAYTGGDPLNRIDPSGRFFQAILVNAAIAGGTDLFIQLWNNNGNWSCVNWGDVASAAYLGALLGSAGEVVVGLTALDELIIFAEAEGGASGAAEGAAGAARGGTALSEGTAGATSAGGSAGESATAAAEGGSPATARSLSE